MQKHFVRTIFWGCTQNLHLATGLEGLKEDWFASWVTPLYIKTLLISFAYFADVQAVLNPCSTFIS